MTPYYSNDGIEIYHGDGREIMPQLTYRAQAVVTDPPYGETSLDWDKQVRGWMDMAQSITRNIWCFGSLSFFMEMARTGECSRWTKAQEIIWEKHNGSGFHADRFKRVHELAVQFYTGAWESIYKSPVMTSDSLKRTIRHKARPAHMGHIEESNFTSEDGGPRIMRSVIYVRSCHGEAVHPTQKPVGIIHPLLEYSINSGGTVVDCFMGSGSTLVAAKERGLQATGIDIDERCCEIAAKRLDQEVMVL